MPVSGLAPNDVDDGEDHDPDGVDEVPVEGEGLDALAVTLIDVTRQRKREDGEQHDEADDDVGGVEPDERVVRRADEEDDAEGDGGAPPGGEAADAAMLDVAFGEPDGDAAREEEDGVEDGDFE